MPTQSPPKLTVNVGENDLLTAATREFLAHRAELVKQWRTRLGEAHPFGIRAIADGQHLADALFDRYVSALGQQSAAATRQEAEHISGHAVTRQDAAPVLLTAILTLRDVLSRMLMERLAKSPARMAETLDALEGQANYITSVVAERVVTTHQDVIRRQQEAIKELTAPVLRIRDRLLLHPIVGPVDVLRMQEITEGLLRAVSENRARVVVMDITGVPRLEAAVAEHLVQTVAAARLLGARVIVTGLSPEIALRLVELDIDPQQFHAAGYLQEGISEAEEWLTRIENGASAAGKETDHVP